MDIDPTGELEKSLIKLSKEEKKAKKKHRQETQGIIVTALGNPGDRIGNFLYFAHEFNSVGVKLLCTTFIDNCPLSQAFFSEP